MQGADGNKRVAHVKVGNNALNHASISIVVESDHEFSCRGVGLQSLVEFGGIRDPL